MTEQSSPTFCGYIDLLGTRVMAKNGPQTLLEGLNKFHAALDAAYKVFPSGSCYAFSDGAFFTCNSVDDFVSFYKQTRNDLFQARHFFRCSFLQGDIDVDPHGKIPRQIKGSSKREPGFFSIAFRGDAPRAYQLESAFKGIGCTIAISKADEQFKGQFIRSFHVVADGKRLRAVQHFDVIFDAFELSKPVLDENGIPKKDENKFMPIFDQVVDTCSETMIGSDKIASYYISVLASMIISVDLSVIDDSEVSADNQESVRYPMRELIWGGTPKALRSLTGIHLLLLACYSKLCRPDKILKNLEDALLTRMSSFPNCFRNLDEVPDYVISEYAKNRLIKRRVTDQRAGDVIKKIKQPKS